MVRKVMWLLVAVLAIGLATTSWAECGGGCCGGDKDSKADAGKCPAMGTMKASMNGGECTMKAGEKKVDATTAETKDVAVEKLPDGIVDGNVYTLPDGGKRFICPVEQGQAFVKDAASHADYEGKRYYFCCAGCPEKFSADPKKFIAALAIPANIIKVADNKVTAKCPVSKEEITVKSGKTPSTDYNGKRYYFCCKNCLASFTKDPSKFITVATPDTKDKAKDKETDTKHS